MNIFSKQNAYCTMVPASLGASRFFSGRIGFNRICLIILFHVTWMASTVFAGEEAIVITEEGFVGINTSSPTETLEVEGDVYVKGTIYTDEAYKDWAVGQYYSIPMDQRSTTPDINIENLPLEWTVYDLSSKLPSGVKRIRVYIFANGLDGTNETFLFYARSFGSSAALGLWSELERFIVGKAGEGVVAEHGWEAEIDVSQDGKFELCDDAEGTYRVANLQIYLRGFYK